MKTLENIKKVALIFFIIIGITHIVSGLMVSNRYFMPISLIINRILDIPFVLAALIYGFSGILINHYEQKKWLGRIFIGVTLFIFTILVYINFLLPDKLSV